MDTLDRIDRLLKANGWSRSELMRRIGLTVGMFEGWKKGKASPDKHLAAIARELNTTEDYLCGKTDDPTPPPSPETIQKVIEHLGMHPGAIPVGPAWDKMMSAYEEKVYEKYQRANSPKFDAAVEEARKNHREKA